MATNVEGVERTRMKGEAIISLLTQKVRVIAEAQAAKAYFGDNKDPRKAAREIFRALESKGLLVQSRSLLHPVLSLEAPLCSWRPGEMAPDFGRLAWRIQKRWTEKPINTLTARATEKARCLTGGAIGGRPERRTELLHDVHIAERYLKLVLEDPALAITWKHEDALYGEGRFGAGDKVPDAIISKHGEGEVAIDFGGRYKVGKVREIHEGMARQMLAYEIW